MRHFLRQFIATLPLAVVVVVRGRYSRYAHLVKIGQLISPNVHFVHKFDVNSVLSAVRNISFSHNGRVYLL